MRVPSLTLRQEKGSPLTAQEHDDNLSKLRNFSNSLSARVGVSLKANGSLQDGLVVTDTIANRVVTQPKLAWDYFMFAETTGTNSYEVTVEPTDDFEYKVGLVLAVKFANANTGACELNVNGQGFKSLKRFGGATEFEIGEIAAGSLYLVAYDGEKFQAIGSSANAVARSEFTVLNTTAHAFSSFLTATTSDGIPFDGTIPQSGEGIEYATLSYTPKSSASDILVEFHAEATPGGAGTDSHRGLAVALFKDSDLGAFAASGIYVTERMVCTVRASGIVESTGTTPITFKVRFGPRPEDNVSMYMLPTQASVPAVNLGFGGTNKAILKITEYL